MDKNLAQDLLAEQADAYFFYRGKKDDGMRPHTVFDFLQTPVTVRFVQLIDLIRHDQDIFVVRFQLDEQSPYRSPLPR